MGLFQKQAAELIGADETSIYNWESNRVEPAVRLIPGIIRFLGYCPYSPRLSRASRLKLGREYAGLSRKKLANALGVDEGMLALCETEGSNQNKKRKAVTEAALKLLS